MPLHSLRHAHATYLLSAGIHPKIVQERLSHSSIQITLNTYSHVAPGLQEAAAQKMEVFLSENAKPEKNVDKSSGKRIVRRFKSVILRLNSSEPSEDRTRDHLIKS